ncbi:hypothetical protein H9P43_002047 [Blastocladiella emersonii ATCC 22665]|nr:hypothetical protein H9P43_002047 [Blastocladiella emersonii ATCC 22665]
MPSSAPLPGLAGSTVVIRGQLAWVVGGSNFASGPTDSVVMLDLTSSFDVADAAAQFTPAAGLPLRLADPLTAFSSAGHLRVAGGQSYNAADSWVPNERGLFDYDADADLWRTLIAPANAIRDPVLTKAADAAAPLTLAEAGIQTTLFASTLGSPSVAYAFGGSRPFNSSEATDGVVTSEMRVLSLDDPIRVSNVTYARGSPVPRPRTSALLLQLNATHLFVSGGNQGNEVPMDDWWLFDIDKKAWTPGAQRMKRARFSHRAVLYDNRYVVQSGGWMDSSAGPFLECVDLVTGTVSAVESSSATASPWAPSLMTRHNVILAGSQLLMFGGFAEWNASLPTLQHNTRMYVGKLSPPTPNAPLSIDWLPEYEAAPLLPPSYMADGRPGTAAVWIAVAISLVAIAASTLALGLVRRAREPAPTGKSALAWMCWWRPRPRPAESSGFRPAPISIATPPSTGPASSSGERSGTASTGGGALAATGTSSASVSWMVPGDGEDGLTDDEACAGGSVRQALRTHVARGMQHSPILKRMSHIFASSMSVHSQLEYASGASSSSAGSAASRRQSSSNGGGDDSALIPSPESPAPAPLPAHLPAPIPAIPPSAPLPAAIPPPTTQQPQAQAQARQHAAWWPPVNAGLADAAAAAAPRSHAAAAAAAEYRAVPTRSGASSPLLVPHLAPVAMPAAPPPAAAQEQRISSGGGDAFAEIRERHQRALQQQQQQQYDAAAAATVVAVPPTTPGWHPHPLLQDGEGDVAVDEVEELHILHADLAAQIQAGGTASSGSVSAYDHVDWGSLALSSSTRSDRTSAA